MKRTIKYVLAILFLLCLCEQSQCRSSDVLATIVNITPKNRADHNVVVKLGLVGTSRENRESVIRTDSVMVSLPTWFKDGIKLKRCTLVVYKDSADLLRTPVAVEIKERTTACVLEIHSSLIEHAELQFEYYRQPEVFLEKRYDIILKDFVQEELKVIKSSPVNASKRAETNTPPSKIRTAEVIEKELRAVLNAEVKWGKIYLAEAERIIAGLDNDDESWLPSIKERRGDSQGGYMMALTKRRLELQKELYERRGGDKFRRELAKRRKNASKSSETEANLSSEDIKIVPQAKMPGNYLSAAAKWEHSLAIPGVRAPSKDMQCIRSSIHRPKRDKTLSMLSIWGRIDGKAHMTKRMYYKSKQPQATLMVKLLSGKDDETLIAEFEHVAYERDGKEEVRFSGRTEVQRISREQQDTPASQPSETKAEE